MSQLLYCTQLSCIQSINSIKWISPTMSDTIERSDLERSKGKPKAGSSTSANVLKDPDRYGSAESKEEIKRSPKV
jgi:hypothetical protein